MTESPQLHGTVGERTQAERTLSDQVDALVVEAEVDADVGIAVRFAYGVGEHSDRRWGDRYGEGTFAGKRAMLIVTAGGWEEHCAARGINGPIDDLLFPINHGILYYPGYDVLPPFVVYRTDRLDETGFEPLAERLRQRMRTLATTPPIP